MRSNLARAGADESISMLTEILDLIESIDEERFPAGASIHGALRDTVKKAPDDTRLPELIKRGFAIDLTRSRDSEFHPDSYWSVLHELPGSERESVSADLVLICHQKAKSPQLVSRMSVVHSCVLCSVGDTDAACKLMQLELTSHEPKVDGLEAINKYANTTSQALRIAAVARQQPIVLLCWDNLLNTIKARKDFDSLKTLVRVAGDLCARYHQLIVNDATITRWFDLVAELPAEAFEQRYFARSILEIPRNARNEGVAEAAAIANQLLPHVEALRIQISPDDLLIPFLQLTSALRRQIEDIEGADQLQERLIELCTRDGIAHNSTAIYELASAVRRLHAEPNRDAMERAFERLMLACGFRGRAPNDRERKALFDRYTVKTLSKLARDLIGDRVPEQTTEILNCLLSISSPEGLDEIDPVLDDVITRFISRAQIEEAEKMVNARLSSPGSTGALSTRWLIRLSEIQLALSKASQSEQTFEKAFQIALLLGAPTEHLFQQRAAFLSRAGYPDEADAVRKRLPQPSVTEIVPRVYFLFFATEHLSVKGNLQVSSQDGSQAVDHSDLRFGRSVSDSAHIGSFGTITVAGRWDRGGVVKPMSSEAKREIKERAKFLTRAGAKDANTAEPLPALDLSKYYVQPPLLIDNEERDGDDIVIAFEADHFGDTGRQRIFITDEFPTTSPAAMLRRHEGRPRDLQIWYAGTRDIIIEHNSVVAGLIYAPNARVRLGPNNVVFFGAIVAREIIAEGNLTLVFDTSLYGVDLTQM